MLKKDSGIYKSLAALIESIKNSEIYQAYQNATEEVRKNPGLQEQIDDYRKRNFVIHQKYDGDELLSKLEELDAETALFRSQRLVDNYLSAELAFVRLKQDIDNKMLAELEFNTPGSV